jgi:hypothetical protein
LPKTQKLAFKLSIGLNLILIAFILWGFMKMNFVKEQVLLTEVQDNLVELEGLIAHQSENNWKEPNLVTTELGDVLNGIWLGMMTGKQLGTLSASEKDSLERLHSRLSQYPHDELYRFSALTEKDQQDFEELRSMLREAGFGLRIQMSGNLESFMEKAKALEELLLNSLSF